jgi:two-component system LytT family response regulator
MYIKKPHMNKIIRAAIIDDEIHCLKTLRYQIERQFEDVEIVFATHDSLEAKSLVESGKPELIFLDIEMPGLNGLQFLAQFDPIDFKVIFTTAYDQYAVKAIRLNALDYLLKPVDRHDLEEAIAKFRKERDKTLKEQVSQLHLFRERKITDTIALSTAAGLFFVKIDEIMYLEGDDCYTHVIMNDRRKFLISKTLANFCEILGDDPHFFRAHKSFSINLRYVRQYLRGDGGEIIMQDDKRIALSRNNKEAFLQLFRKV